MQTSLVTKKQTTSSLDAIQESDLRMGPGEENEEDEQIDTAVNDAQLQFVSDKDFQQLAKIEGTKVKSQEILVNPLAQHDLAQAASSIKTDVNVATEDKQSGKQVDAEADAKFFSDFMTERPKRTSLPSMQRRALILRMSILG